MPRLLFAISILPVLLTLAEGVAVRHESEIVSEEIAGPWDVTWPQSIRRNEDGSIEVLKTRVSRLVLNIDGRTISGTWQGVRGQVSITGGVTAPGQFHFATAEPADDEDRVVIEFRGTVSDGTLAGTMEFQWPGGRAAPGRRWTGVRPPDDSPG